MIETVSTDQSIKKRIFAGENRVSRKKQNSYISRQFTAMSRANQFWKTTWETTGEPGNTVLTQLPGKGNLASRLRQCHSRSWGWYDPQNQEYWFDDRSMNPEQRWRTHTEMRAYYMAFKQEQPMTALVQPSDNSLNSGTNTVPNSLVSEYKQKILSSGLSQENTPISGATGGGNVSIDDWCARLQKASPEKNPADFTTYLLDWILCPASAREGTLQEMEAKLHGKCSPESAITQPVEQLRAFDRELQDDASSCVSAVSGLYRGLSVPTKAARASPFNKAGVKTVNPDAEDVH